MDRLKEGSTWAGLAALLQTIKSFAPPAAHAVIDALSMLAAGVAGALPDRGKVTA